MSIKRKLFKSMINERPSFSLKKTETKPTPTLLKCNNECCCGLQVLKKEFDNQNKTLLESLNIDGVLQEKMKNDKLKNFINDFVYNKEDESVYFKDVPEVKLHKNAIGKLVDGINIIKNTKTKSINDVITMENYNRINNTIDINKHPFKISDILHFERALVHYL